jgi:hypothetical protein
LGDSLFGIVGLIVEPAGAGGSWGWRYPT